MRECGSTLEGLFELINHNYMVSHLPPGHLDLMGQQHESRVKDARMVENNTWDETDVIKMGEPEVGMATIKVWMKGVRTKQK